MSAAMHTRAAATAERLIRKHGRTATLVKLARALVDPTKPHGGVITDPQHEDYDGEELPVPAAFIDPSMQAARQFWSTLLGMKTLGSTLMDAEMAAFVPASVVGGRNLESFDRVRDGANEWSLNAADALKPGEVPILWTLRLKAAR